MKHEFEALYGEEVTIERFRMINELYMYYDELFPEKKDIVEFYKNNGFPSLYGLIGDYTKNYDNSDGSGATVHYHDNGQPVTESNYNENNFYITYSPKFLNGLNDKLQNKVHALDGYYLYTPVYPNADALISYLTTNKSSYFFDKYLNGTEEQKSNINLFFNALKQAPTCFFISPKHDQNNS